MTLVVPCGFQGFIYCNFLMYILFPLCVPVPVPDALGICFIWRVFFPPVLLYTRGDSGTTCVLKWPHVGLLSCPVHESIRQKLYPHLKISSYFFIYYYYYFYYYYFFFYMNFTYNRSSRKLMKRMPRGPRLQHCWKRRYDHYLVSCSNVMQGSSIELYSLRLVGMHSYFKFRDSFHVKQVGLRNRLQRTYGLSWPFKDNPLMVSPGLFKDNPVKFASDGS